MTSKVDSGGHSGLKFCTHAPFMVHYRHTNFHQKRMGSGTVVFNLAWNDGPYAICHTQIDSFYVATSVFKFVPTLLLLLQPSLWAKFDQIVKWP